MENKSVYGSLDEISESLRRIEERIDRKEPVRTEVERRNAQFSLKNFIARSVHEYLWFGFKEAFEKEKKTALLLILASVASMIVTTVATTAAFGMYSTYTLFENIWLLLMFCILKYTYKAKRSYPTFEYSINSFLRFEEDADGVLQSTVYKKKYKWFLILGCIAFLLNALCAWIVNCSAPLLITILELGTLALNIFAVFKVTDFFAGYNQIKFTGMNETGTAQVVLVFNTVINELYTEEDYLKKYPFIK